MDSFTVLLERLQQLDTYLFARQTGTPDQLAAKLGISRSGWYELKQIVENLLGAPLAYDKRAQTYYYAMPGRIVIGFQKKFEEKNYSPLWLDCRAYICINPLANGDLREV